MSVVELASTFLCLADKRMFTDLLITFVTVGLSFHQSKCFFISLVTRVIDGRQSYNNHIVSCVLNVCSFVRAMMLLVTSLSKHAFRSLSLSLFP
jgi:hypothetical protein